jgi:hypothetical protein
VDTPGLVWTGAENLDPTEIRSPDRLALSEPLYIIIYSYFLTFCVSVL